MNGLYAIFVGVNVTSVKISVPRVPRVLQFRALLQLKPFVHSANSLHLTGLLFALLLCFSVHFSFRSLHFCIHFCILRSSSSTRRLVCLSTRFSADVISYISEPEDSSCLLLINSTIYYLIASNKAIYNIDTFINLIFFSNSSFPFHLIFLFLSSPFQSPFNIFHRVFLWSLDH